MATFLKSYENGYYKPIVGEEGSLTRSLLEMWSDTPSRSSIAILLSATNNLLNKAAMATNHFVHLNQERTKKTSFNSEIYFARKNMLNAHKTFMSLSTSSTPDTIIVEQARNARSEARSAYRQSTRRHQQADCDARDAKLRSVLSNDPSSLYNHI